VINNVFSRLSSFSGSNGTLKVDWLSQWASSPNVALRRRRPVLPDARPANLTESPPALGGTGLLDKLAENKARAAMADGSITSIGLSLPRGAALPGRRRSRGVAEPALRFLAAGFSGALRDLYLNATHRPVYRHLPHQHPGDHQFHGLINVQLSDIEFTIGINYTQPMTSLDAEQ